MSMRLYKSILLFWLNKTKTCKKYWILLSRLMTSWEETLIERRSSIKLRQASTLPSINLRPWFNKLELQQSPNIVNSNSCKRELALSTPLLLSRGSNKTEWAQSKALLELEELLTAEIMRELSLTPSLEEEIPVWRLALSTLDQLVESFNNMKDNSQREVVTTQVTKLELDSLDQPHMSMLLSSNSELFKMWEVASKNSDLQVVNKSTEP